MGFAQATYDGSPGCPYSDDQGNCYNADGSPAGSVVGGGTSQGGGTNASSDGNAGLLSGLGGLFGAIGSGVSTGIRAANPVSTIKTPYLTATGANTSVIAGLGIGNTSMLPLLILAFLAFLIFGRKSREE